MPCPEQCDPLDEENLDEYNLQLDEEQAEIIAESIQDLSFNEKVAFLEGFSLKDKKLILSNLPVEDQAQVILQLSIQQNGNPDENVEKWLSNLPKSNSSGVTGSDTEILQLSGSVSLFEHKNEEYLAKMVYQNPLNFAEIIENNFGASSGEKAYHYKLVDEIGVFDSSSQGGLQAFIFKREDGVPVIVFRGTEPNEIGDVLTDLNPNGVGYSQFYNANNFERLSE